MEPTPALLASATTQLQKLFKTERFNFAPEEEVFDRVSAVVAHLLRTDINRLLHILYRIDVNEQDVKLAMTAGSKAAIATQLARLILNRELQKAHTRLRYSQKQG